MTPTQDEIYEAVLNLDIAKAAVRDAQYKLENMAYDLLDMPLREALKAKLIRFNFPTTQGFKKAIS